MIKIDNLDEYVSIKAIINYCSSHNECLECKIKPICDVCSGNIPLRTLNVKYEPKKEEEKTND